MLWNIDYEVASFFVLLVLSGFFLAKDYLRSRQNMYFFYVMVLLCVLSALSVITSYTISYPSSVPVWLNYILNMAYYFIMVSQPVLFILYVLSTVHKLSSMKVVHHVMIELPMRICQLVLLTTPWTGWIISFDENGVYSRGPLWWIYFAITVCYLILTSVIMIMFRKDVEKMQLIGVCSFSIFSIAAIIMQFLVVKGSLMVGFGTMLSVIVLYMSLQNPDYYINRTSMTLNKEGFLVSVKDLLERGVKFRVVMVDLGSLSSLGQLYGADMEQKIQLCIAEELKVRFGKGNVYSISENRFAVLFPESGKKKHPDFEAVRKEIVAEIVKRLEVDLQYVICLMSCPDYGSTPEEILLFTEFAIKTAKRDHRRDIVVIDENVLKEYDRAFKVKAALKHAIDTESVQVFYQPIFSPKEGRVVAAEALARLYDDELGWIPPVEFIAYAEEDASIRVLGKQIFSKVCGFIKDHDMEGLDLNYISINLSPVQCIQVDLCRELEKIVNSYGISPNYVTLEITESVQIQSTKTVQDMMSYLQGIGMNFSLDDYGTGYSNLSYIADINFNIIKLDRSILLSYFDKQNGMMQYLIDMFKRLNLSVVAEGVETKEMADKLKELGCDYLQGYYYSKPVDSAEFVSYVWNANRNSYD